jgi:hypothetical protein
MALDFSSFHAQNTFTWTLWNCVGLFQVRKYLFFLSIYLVSENNNKKNTRRRERVWDGRVKTEWPLSSSLVCVGGVGGMGRGEMGIGRESRSIDKSRHTQSLFRRLACVCVCV